MLRVFADAGLSVRRQTDDGVIEFTCHLPDRDADPGWEPYLEAVDERESQAEAASLRHIFRPGSVAVVGAGRRPGTVGRAILHNIVTGGYAGHVYAVNPYTTRMEGVPCLPSVTNLPGPVDLAVVAVPPSAVPAVADECGRRGQGPGRGHRGARGPPGRRPPGHLPPVWHAAGRPELLRRRRAGHRAGRHLCLRHPAPGIVGLVMQSGGLGVALVDHLSRLGLGISLFASVGSKYDVSSNDMLMWWEQDDTTRLAVLYIESFGNPRKFARTAQRVSRKMPILALEAGRSEAGRQAAASHTGAVAAPLISRDALFEQAGLSPGRKPR